MSRLFLQTGHDPQRQDWLAGAGGFEPPHGGIKIHVILAFGLLSSSAFAQEGLEKRQLTRVVASGANQRIGFFTALNPDCTASGNVNIRVTKQPEHGSTETTTTINFPAYPKEHSRSKCNDHKVRGMQVNYKSAEKYVGSDELELLVLFPNGFAWEVRYNIDVR
jgi:hypothetical protein